MVFGYAMCIAKNHFSNVLESSSVESQSAKIYIAKLSDIVFLN